ncbi:MAG: DegT/DnrJ/EryC1/StrS family aminotransferase [Planctomycetota bacterium]|nr:DegT/DnrJ/EryC1/StrS family aminotransferase [Planctomycetota bacterium]
MTQTNSPAHTPIRTKPLPGLGPRYTGREVEFLKEALTRNNLFYYQADGLVTRMLARAKQELGAPFAVPASSGTASLHVAVAGLGIPAGYEVITSPITDMGTAVAILYQNAVPVFAEVDPRTFNITAKSIEAVITERTRAVVLVHLAGTPADMDEIVALCKARKIALIEDCAQSWGATYKGKAVGNFGDAGCYSFNDFKHLSCGDGGFIITHDEAAYRSMHNCGDKYYDRLAQGNRLAGLGANYRMTELQGAVALAHNANLFANNSACKVGEGCCSYRGRTTSTTCSASTSRPWASPVTSSSSACRPRASPPRRATSRARSATSRSSSTRTSSPAESGRPRSSRAGSTTIRR